jgi:hypothetical protein
MTKYVKLDNQNILSEFDTITEIPQEVWTKKNILPLITVQRKYMIGETPERVDGDYFFEDRVERVVNNYIKEPTLDELKIEKIEQLNIYLAPKFPKVHKQTNTALGIYDEVKSEEIKAQITNWRDYFHIWENEINNCATKYELNVIDFRTEEDKSNEKWEQ